MTAEQAEPRSSYWLGMAAAFGLDFLVPSALSVGIAFLTMPFRPANAFGHRAISPLSMIPAFLSLGIGLAQWLWLIPFARRRRLGGKPEFAKGVMSGGWIVLLLNAGCWGIVGSTFLLKR